MVRWGDVTHTAENAMIAGASFRPDLYRTAIAPIATGLPQIDARPLGASSFFDGKGFDPAELDSYIAGQQWHI